MPLKKEKKGKNEKKKRPEKISSFCRALQKMGKAPLEVGASPGQRPPKERVEKDSHGTISGRKAMMAQRAREPEQGRARAKAKEMPTGRPRLEMGRGKHGTYGTPGRNQN